MRGSKGFKIISYNPKLTIRKMMYESVIDLDLYGTNYTINEDGIKIISERIKKLEPYIDKASKRYLEYIPCRSMNIKILNEYADELLNFLLETVSNKKYLTKMCDDSSDIVRYRKRVF
jgi:hypothetical protein